MSAPYGLPPEHMTPVQRTEEVVSILVNAILRARAAAGTDLTEAELALGFSAPQRVNANSSQSEKRKGDE